MVASAAFRRTVTIPIVINALVIGLETYPSVAQGIGGLLNAIDRAILFAFTAEASLPWDRTGGSDWIHSLAVARGARLSSPAAEPRGKMEIPIAGEIGMLRFPAILAALCVSLGQDDAAREAVRGYAHPWAGFRAGTRLIFNEITQAASFDQSLGRTTFKDKITQHVWVVKSASADRVTIHMEAGSLESDIPIYLDIPAKFRGKGEARGEEVVVVGRRSYRCSVTAISLDLDKDAGQVTRIYRCPDAPLWAVKVVAETFIKGNRNTWEEELLVEENIRLTIDGREVTCQLVKVTTGSEDGRRTVKKEWRSEVIPGGVARRETRYYAGDREIQGSAVIMEVVGFEAKR